MNYLYGRWIGWGGLPVGSVCFVDLCHLPSERLFFCEGHLLIGSLGGICVQFNAGERETIVGKPY